MYNWRNYLIKTKDIHIYKNILEQQIVYTGQNCESKHAHKHTHMNKNNESISLRPLVNKTKSIEISMSEYLQNIIMHTSILLRKKNIYK